MGKLCNLELNRVATVIVRVILWACHIATIVYWIYCAYYMIRALVNLQDKDPDPRYDWILYVNGGTKENNRWDRSSSTDAFCYIIIVLSCILAVLSVIPPLEGCMIRKKCVNLWAKFLLAIVLAHILFGILVLSYGYSNFFFGCIGLAIFFLFTAYLNWEDSKGNLDIFEIFVREREDESGRYTSVPTKRIQFM